MFNLPVCLVGQPVEEMDDSNARALSVWDFFALFFSILSAVYIIGICKGNFTGDSIFPASVVFLIGILFDFFSGKSWVAKLAVAIHILVAFTTLAAIAQFFGGMDH